MYEMRERIRYSEVVADGVLSWGSLLNYFQDCSVAHSDSCGLGMDYLSENYMAWILISWQIVRKSFPRSGTEVLVRTWPYRFKGMYGYRNFVIEAVDGGVCAFANSIWALMNTENGRPRRIPEEFAGLYGMEDPYPMEYRDRKLSTPEVFTEGEPFAVPRYFIDTNGHMNNGKYVLAAQEYLADDFLASEIRVEYRNAAVRGDVLYPRITEEKDRVTVNLTDREGRSSALVLFLRP